MHVGSSFEGLLFSTSSVSVDNISFFLQVQVMIREGTHASEEAINKQLADKERVTAALENTHLLEVVNQCLNIKEDS